MFAQAWHFFRLPHIASLNLNLLLIESCDKLLFLGLCSMPSLSIKNFSCIKEAEFTLKPINVIIGAQGSGKSVTTKLFYFFTDLLVNHIDFAERGMSFEEYTDQIAQKFDNWFPQSAWGNKQFDIEYKAGNFTIKITRDSKDNKLANTVDITFSKWFSDFYEKGKKFINSLGNNKDEEIAETKSLDDDFVKLFRAGMLIKKRLASQLREEYIRLQTFIPAGRGFFTNIGRLVASSDVTVSLDAVTKKFARIFAFVRDQGAKNLPQTAENNHYNELMNKLLGGYVEFKDKLEYIVTSDGRNVPFSFLSSGQQELLPLLMILDYLNREYPFRILKKPIHTDAINRLLYIEEPEAHLFPSAQSHLMEFLVGSIATNASSKLIATTHSPYIMSKLNVFLKAGEIAKDESKRDAVRKIVPEECWLTTQQLGAYCIEEGVLKNIVNAEDGLVDSTYLDQISEDLSNDFEDLLNIEFEME